jgi:uncharacterized protein
LDPVFGEPPERSGLVEDDAGLLEPDDRERLEARLGAFATSTGGEIVLITRETSAPRLPSELVFWLFNRWEIGGAEHRGVALLLCKEERRIECEIGHGFEHLLDDEASNRILEWHAAPLLRRGRYGEGLWHAVDLVATVIENAGVAP